MKDIHYYHAVKTKAALKAIMREMVLRGGTCDYDNAYVSTVPLNWMGLDICGPDTNEAWVLKLSIIDTGLLPDPMGEEAKYYGGGEWLMAPLITITKVLHVEHIKVVRP